ncbi:MAG: T9SS type A sorting domain-containing protein, partial [Calditrichaceae bacterium]
IAINNGFFEGDSLIPDMSSVFLDSEIDLGLDEEGNLYAGWLDRPGNPVRLAPKPRYSTSSDPDYKTDVFVARSDDGGVNWSERINLTQSVNNDEYELNMAKTVSSEDNGTAYVTYCIAADPNDNTETYIDGVNMIWVSERKDFVDVTGINDETEPALLKDLSLKQNYPNPFNPSTKIEFTAGVTGQAVMEIYDCTGRKVDEIYNNRVQKNGTYQVTYYAESLAAGVYFYRLTNGSQIAVKKMILLK